MMEEEKREKRDRGRNERENRCGGRKMEGRGGSRRREQRQKEEE